MSRSRDLSFQQYAQLRLRRHGPPLMLRPAQAITGDTWAPLTTLERRRPLNPSSTVSSDESSGNKPAPLRGELASEHSILDAHPDFQISRLAALREVG